MERSTGPGSLRAERPTGSGNLRMERSTGPGSLRAERPTGSGNLRMERSTGPGSLRAERSTGPGSLRTERSTGQEAFGRNDPPDQEVFGRNGPRVRKPSGGTIRRIRKSSDSMIRGEVSGVFFGTRCMGPASAHLAPLFMRAARPHHSSTAHSKGPARFQLNERRSRTGPPVCVRIWTPHPSTGGLVFTGAESCRQPNFVVR
jgi:hypothetical protein